MPETAPAVLHGVPDLAVPFPLRVNLGLDAVRGRDMAWAKATGLVSSPADERRYRSWDLALLVAGWLPDAPADGLDVAANAFNWCTVYDDLHAGDKSTDVRHARTLQRPLLDYLATGTLAASPSPLLLALHDIVTRERQRAPREAHPRITHDWSLFIAAFLEETGNRKAGQPLAFTEYRALRRRSGAVNLMLDLIEIAGGYHTTPRARSVPVFQELLDSANDAICFINDLYSHVKEEAAGDPHNLVFVVQNERRCPRAQAIERAAEITLDACDDVLLRQSRLRAACRQAGLSPREAASAQRFAFELAYPISSMASWQRQSARYWQPDNTLYGSGQAGS
ncbi:MAG TPA: hypothetical protein VH478_17780 [Trebonia sp.]|jgi:hypothetical protein|nr:hypothetical protein [Trebonia sp.]